MIIIPERIADKMFDLPWLFCPIKIIKSSADKDSS